jgi:hypothetical protein
MDILDDIEISAALGDVTMGTAGNLVCSCSIEQLSAFNDIGSTARDWISAVANLDFAR